MIALDHHYQNIMSAVEFVDYFPSMIARMGDEGFIGELCSGFRLLMDVEKGLITFESLKRNCVLLGLYDMGDDELLWMLMEGDLDGDGALSQMEFCILMFRLSPGIMDGSKQFWMEDFDHRRVNDHQMKQWCYVELGMEMLIIRTILTRSGRSYREEIFHSDGNTDSTLCVFI
ncbi:hypothetical protein ACFX13_031427 [Malus domestica]|uniref:EF-hand domain-containing protein n=1 Tax=Malus domestica TaxID=3750 RepID=A0A498K5W6_MALDO|nr:hypothetical protein DVH24_004302 [Malus domestica]RXI09215.1 hypothetical protein DVH24_023376 [Malus domestica]RXI09922.1 hypothetical protein DVH24_018976 [Malus domestica]RXI10088.1 hypothetical protein DVH24_018540 [Malus domestica]